jgi:hypothetical protein
MPDNTAPVTCTLEFELATGVWTLSPAQATALESWLILHVGEPHTVS